MKELKSYRYIIAGTGLFGATVAERLASQGHKILIIDKRDHLAGNVYSYTDPDTNIEVHKYGSHIFHTEFDEVWDYITKFTEFNDYIHTVDTRHKGKLYPMPINLDTINLLYGTDMDAEAAEKFVAAEAEKEGIKDPKNFEEKGLSLVGRKLHEAFLRNYTAKQWSTDPKNLSAAILNRIPVRFNRDNRYFITAKHQGIPKEGYTKIVENMLANDLIDVKLNTDIKKIIDNIPGETTIIYCGQIDELLDYEFGVLPYRSLMILLVELLLMKPTPTFHIRAPMTINIINHISQKLLISQNPFFVVNILPISKKAEKPIIQSITTNPKPYIKNTLLSPKKNIPTSSSAAVSALIVTGIWILLSKTPLTLSRSYLARKSIFPFTISFTF